MGKVNLPTLQPGDKVALIAPARAVSPEEMEPFLKWCKGLELQVQLGKHLYGRHHQFSGTDSERGQDFIEAWTDPEIKAVLCARGGYGCMRLLPFIHEDVWQKGNGKILAGYSDITTLHLALNARGMASIHSPMAINFLNPDEDGIQNMESFEKILLTGKFHLDLSTNEIINPGSFSGDLVGGNLSLLFASLGTPEQPNTDDKVLFFEDLDEYFYHIDRMIVSLKRAGIFSKIKGLLVGGMDKMNDNAIAFGQTAQEIIGYHTQEFGFPIVFDFPAGHGSKNFSFKLGANITFDGSILTQI